MKARPKGFLSQKNIDHDSEAFDYIKELHEYLWKFIRLADPGATSNIADCVDKALLKATDQRDAREKIQEILSYLNRI